MDLVLVVIIICFLYISAGVKCKHMKKKNCIDHNVMVLSVKMMVGSLITFICYIPTSSP